MDLEIIVNNALLASASLGAAYAARTARKARGRLEENTQKLDDIADTRLDERIRATVVEVLAAEEGDALRTYVHRLMRSPVRTIDD